MLIWKFENLTRKLSGLKICPTHNFQIRNFQIPNWLPRTIETPATHLPKINLLFQNISFTFTGNYQSQSNGKTSDMNYIIDIQLFTPPIYIFLVWVVLVLCCACCTRQQQLVLHSFGSNPTGRKPARPGPLIFEPSGRLVLNVGRAAGKIHIQNEIVNQTLN